MINAAAFARPRRLLVIGAAATLTLALGACSGATGAAPASEGRTVSTEFGDVVVPTTIDSVVVLEGRRDLDIVLALGLPLVAMPYVGDDTGLVLEEPLADVTAAAVAGGATELFLEDEINLEAIAEVAPSLIISRNSDIEPIFDELNAIAPVLSIHSHGDGVTWQEDLLFIAGATGTEDEAEQVIAAYDARVAEIAATYAAQIAATPVVGIGYGAEGTSVQSTRLLNAALFAVGGMPSQTLAESTKLVDDSIESSPEQTLEAHKDAGAILVAVDTDEEWAMLQSDALWAQLPAVKAGNVVRTDKMTNEGGPTTAMHTLDLVEQLYQGI